MEFSTGCETQARFSPARACLSLWPTPPVSESSFPGLGEDAETQIRAIRDHLIDAARGPEARNGPPEQRRVRITPSYANLADLKVGNCECMCHAMS
jgi:hypothetical protein